MTQSLNKKEIIDLLPHREPMLLIDELINIKKLHSATAIVYVKKKRRKFNCPKKYFRSK